MPSDKRLRWFGDILDNIERIERFTADKDFRGFLADERSMYAVLHALLIVSEAARRLSTDAEILVPEQPWRAIRDLGNVLRHEYGGVDPARIWQIVQEDLPTLKTAVEQAIANLKGSS